VRKFIFTYLILAFMAITYPQKKNFSVDEITISTLRDTTYIQVLTDGSVDFKKFTIDNPPKLGVDFFGGIFSLPQNEYLKVPPGLIAAVRGSQFKPQPEPVARLVFDLVETPEYSEVRLHPEGVMIAIYTPDYPQIAKWSSGRVEALAETTAAESVAVAETAVVDTTDTTKAEIALEAEEILPELAVYMRPETLSYKGVTADMETIEVAKYIRNMVVYTAEGNDPFLAPKRTKETPLGTEPIPMVENLSLVGIVQMGDMNLALMQDQSGFGFVIAAGDTVEGGICIAVTDTSARFTLTEFGTSRKVDIPLVKPEK